MTQEIVKGKSKFSADKKQIFTLPNILTYIRILCVPIVLIVYLKGFLMVALAVFLFASFTDIIDGKIARKYNLVSDIGKALDPVADKLLQVTVIVLLTVSERIHWIFAVLIFVKELYMIVGGALLVRKNIVAQANVWGKVAAFLLGVGIILAFLDYLNGIFIFLASIVLTAGVVFTFYAAFIYSVSSLKAYKKYLVEGSDNRIYLEYKKKQ